MLTVWRPSLCTYCGLVNKRLDEWVSPDRFVDKEVTDELLNGDKAEDTKGRKTRPQRRKADALHASDDKVPLVCCDAYSLDIRTTDTESTRR